MSQIQDYFDSLDEEIKNVIREILKLEQQSKRITGNSTSEFKKELLTVIKNTIR